MHVFQLPSLLKCLLSPVTTVLGTGDLNSLGVKCHGKPALLCSQCPILLPSPGTQGWVTVIAPCSVGEPGTSSGQWHVNISPRCHFWAEAVKATPESCLHSRMDFACVRHKLLLCKSEVGLVVVAYYSIF